MSVTIKFLGHAAFTIEADGTTLLVDPFLSGNPKAAVAAADLSPDAILLTHGHGDHLGDTVDIAKRTGAPVVAIVELANELAGDLPDGHPVSDINLGGTATFDWGWARLVPAWHTAVSPSGTAHTPGGLVINIGGKTIYHLGDTALFSDLALPGQRERLDAAIIPIGGHYTMDRHDAARAASLVGAPVVIPCHYDTFPPIETDVAAFAAEVDITGKRTIVLEPGQETEL
ncbi:MAG: metal-dependent hydrolase [Solirubrobacteraceae bacterium]|nr:metal-dependent hydrolase [Solirubrobacteraceae bacterium]